ncbi:MAG: hypothetical protein HGA21_16140 [Burkholderiaceae bacterium]|nr:hypothetical protein [Burkholderiaceae bacterium]
MRATTFTKLILQSLTLVLLYTLAPIARAQGPAYQMAYPMDARGGEHKKWVCQYTREPDGVLYMRCDDLASLMYDGLTMDGDVQPSPTQYIPVWSNPKSESKAIELAQMMLCNRPVLCSVEMASSRTLAASF